MDMRYEAAPMAAEVEVVQAVVTTVVATIRKVASLIRRVASFSCPSIAGHSLSAVAPDHILMNGGLARAA